MTSPAACATCSVLAIGTCADCGRPFCLSHQGYGLHRTPFSDLCITCATSRMAKQNMDAVESAAEVRDREAPAVGSDALRKECIRIAASLIRQFPEATEPVFSEAFMPKRPWRQNDMVTVESGCGWPLGELPWRSYDKERGDIVYTVSCCILESGEVRPLDRPFRTPVPMKPSYILDDRQQRGSLAGGNQTWRDILGILQAAESQGTHSARTAPVVTMNYRPVTGGARSPRQAAKKDMQHSRRKNKVIAQAYEVQRLRSIYPANHPDVIKAMRKFERMGGDPSRIE